MTRKKRIVVAMSGGVDSSVAAAMFVNNGYEVIGLTAQLYKTEVSKVNKTCCAGQDIYDARRVASDLGIAHYVLDYEKIFKKEVINDFVDSYFEGRTPIPCVRCNQKIKFRDLLNTAKQLGAEFLVTGHYVQRIESKKGVELRMANDKDKDQSYFLFQTTKEQLSYLRFPLGSISKAQTREIAKKLNLKVAGKIDSQDICFVPEGNYRKIVYKIKGPGKEGLIKDIYGKVLGKHKGIENFTIGQRKGLGIAIGDPLYVIKINKNESTIIVGTKTDLEITALTISELNWIGEDSYLTDSFSLNLMAKVRSTQKAQRIKIRKISKNIAKIVFMNPIEGAAIGQGCVVYTKCGRLLGGGWIESLERE